MMLAVTLKDGDGPNVALVVLAGKQRGGRRSFESSSEWILELLSNFN